MSTPRPAVRVAIRAVDRDDAPALAQLTGLSASTRRGLDADIAAVARGDAHAPVILVAEVAHPAPAAGTSLVGAAFGLLQYDDGHVLDLAVAARWRRSGIGAALLRALLAALVARGARAVTLEVRAGNLGAQALYRAGGWTVEGRRPGYYPDGEDALLLWWRPGTAPGTAPGTTPGTAPGTAPGSVEAAMTSASGTGGSRC